MKYLPKSKLGLAAAISYLLLIVTLLVLIGISADGNFHNPAPLLLFYLMVILTFPLSWLAMSDFIANEYLAGGIAVCAVILNATVIYFAVGRVSRICKTFFKRRSRGEISD